MTMNIQNYLKGSKVSMDSPAKIVNPINFTGQEEDRKLKNMEYYESCTPGTDT